MKAREFARRHLLREARERIAREHTGPARELSAKLAAVTVDESVLDATIANASKSADLCAFIAQRFAGEHWPEDVMEDVGRRGAWKRELTELARNERE